MKLLELFNATGCKGRHFFAKNIHDELFFYIGVRFCTTKRPALGQKGRFT